MSQCVHFKRQFAMLIFSALASALVHAQDGMISAEVPGQPPADPPRWAKFERVLDINNRAFSAHLLGAKNISVPMAPKEFSWKVNWAAQQKYCKDFAQTLFASSPRIEFAKPNASPARDGVPVVLAAIDKTFPNCTTPATDSWTGLQHALNNMNRGAKGKAPIEYLPTREWIEKSKEDAKRGFGQYLLNRDYLIALSFSAWEKATSPKGLDGGWIDEENIEQALIQPGVIPIFHIEAYRRPHSTNGCPSIGMNSWGDVNSFPDAYYDRMPMALLMFDGEPVKVEYGTYQNGREEGAPKESSRLGRKGQRFVFARPMKHDLWLDWAKSPVPQKDQVLDENHGYIGERAQDYKPMNYRACVINFDAEKTAP